LQKPHRRPPNNALEGARPIELDGVAVPGKRRKVAPVAAMRKLPGMLDAIAKHGSTWDPSLRTA
jgi:hypothetical protein